MAVIQPFRAVRPAKDKVANVVSKSYETYTKSALESVLGLNPYSFLHIINPGFELDRPVSGKARFKRVRKRYLNFLEEEVLVKDKSPCFYLYKIKKKSFSCCGLLCATSTADYENDIIRKHEDTIHRREELFATYLGTVRFNAEPVLMTYEDDQETSIVLKKETEKEPEYEFSTPDNAKHYLWKISELPLIERLQKAFDKKQALYIADGHHRSASSYLWAQMAKQDNPGHKGNETYNYFMSYLIPESEIRIYEFNRLIKDLNQLSKEEFLAKINDLFFVENRGRSLYKPLEKHHFSMYLDGEFYALILKQNAYKFTDALSKLDSQILYKTILDPILGIADLKNDKRIQYGYGKDHTMRMKKEIDEGNFTVGFGMVPITIDEIKGIADAGLVMPPKSTYIAPKLKSGLTIYEF